MEHKTFPAFNTKVDEAQGVVEHIIAVMGNIDMGGDVIHPGSFTKTLNERGGKIRVLDQHQTDSVLRTLGKPVSIQEISRAELPLEVIQRYPEVTGGVKAITQYNLKTQAGHDAFQHILAGDVNEYSIGYDAIQGGTDFSKVKAPDGSEQTVRNLREIKLWEYSPVLWGLNPSTITMSAKADTPSEAKPYDVIHEGDQWCVYKIGPDGKPMGKPLGEHATEEEAQAQLRALYANTGDEGKADAAPDEVKVGRRVASDRVAKLKEALNAINEWIKWAEYDDAEQPTGDESAPPTEEAAPENSQKSQAGPVVTPPTNLETLARLVEIEEQELELMGG